MRLGSVLVAATREGILTLRFGGAVTSIEVIDAAGRQMKSVSLASDHDSIVNIGLPGHLTPGVYFVRFIGAGEMLADRVVIR